MFRAKMEKMKRLTVTLTSCLFLLLSWQIQAQSQVKVIPQVGVNLSGLDTKIGDLRTEAKAGWNAGVDFRIGRGFIYLNPGAHFYSNTARLLRDFDDPVLVMWKGETKIESIKTPLNIGVNLTGTNGLLGFRAEAGFVPTYVLAVQETDTYQLDIEELNRLTWGWNLGVGLDLLFFTADLNYEIGKSNFFKDVEGRNNMVTLSVGIKF